MGMIRMMGEWDRTACRGGWCGGRAGFNGDKPALLEKAFANHVNQPDDAEFGFQAVVLKASGQAIGQVHIEPYVNMWFRVAGDPETPVRNIEVELAFAFGKAYWGRGYAFEACRALVDYAFNELKGGFVAAEASGARQADRSAARFVANPDACPNGGAVRTGSSRE